MTGGWTLLKNKADLRAYQALVAEDNNLGDGTVRWGAEPPVYPCLVASRVISPMQVMACYCLPADARELIHAAADQSIVSQMAAPSSPPDSEITSRQRYDREVTAMLLALVHTACETRLTTQGRFERDYNHFLAMVDQDASLRKEMSAKTAFAAIKHKAIMEEEEPTGGNPDCEGV